jgi:hypothetical protein
MYAFASENIGMVNTNEAFTEEIRNELNAISTALKADCDALSAYLVTEIADLNRAVADFATANPDLVPATEQNNTNEESDKDDSKDQYVAFNKYEVAQNSVVYEKYSNGRTFVLNFNNYAIKVQLDGVSYTIGAYGYIVIA